VRNACRAFRIGCQTQPEAAARTARARRKGQKNEPGPRQVPARSSLARAMPGEGGLWHYFQYFPRSSVEDWPCQSPEEERGDSTGPSHLSPLAQRRGVSPNRAKARSEVPGLPWVGHKGGKPRMSHNPRSSRLVSFTASPSCLRVQEGLLEALGSLNEPLSSKFPGKPPPEKRLFRESTICIIED